MVYGSSPNDREQLIGWEVTCFNDFGGISDIVKATDAEVTLKPAVQDSDFVIDFPPGAVIIDRRGKTASKMVSQGGDQFRAFAPGDESLADRRWIWWGGGAIALIVVVVLVRQHTHLNYRGSSASGEW
jgi:hypothetical protein